MGHSRRHAVARPGWWLAAAAAVGALLTIGSAYVTLRLALALISPPRPRPEDVVVFAVDRAAGTVTLNNHPDTVLPGRYGLSFRGGDGHAQLGQIVAFGSGTVTRALLAETRGRVEQGMHARVTAWFYDDPSQLALDFDEVTIDTDWGPAPAWVVPAGETPRRWVIQVHGRAVDRREVLRAVPACAAAGFTSLLVSYRNDGVAPASGDGLYSLGDTEWNDVEAAIRFAEGAGATDIVVMGWSMGGAIALQAVTRGESAARIRGVILDSPVIDWASVLDHQAGLLRLPRQIVAPVMRIIGRPWGRFVTRQHASIDLERLNFVRRAGELRLPILLMHSDADAYVPSTGSRALARLRPDIVTFEPFDGAGHTRLWNYDQTRWERAITRWLGELPPPSARTARSTRQPEAASTGVDVP